MDKSSSTISIAMEFCEGGSLDSVYREVKKLGGRTGEKVLGKVAEGVLHGLTYLNSRKIIHRGKILSSVSDLQLADLQQISNRRTFYSAGMARSNYVTSESAENSAQKAMPTPLSAPHTTWHQNEYKDSPTPSHPTSGHWA